VIDVIAHETHVVQRYATLVRKRRQGGKLVVHALLHVRDAQIRGTASNETAVTGRDEGDRNASCAQQADALTVEGMKALDDLAVVRVPETAVGQDAVDVEHHQLDARSALAHGGRYAGKNQRFGRVRACRWNWNCSVIPPWRPSDHACEGRRPGRRPHRSRADG